MADFSEKAASVEDEILENEDDEPEPNDIDTKVASDNVEVETEDKVAYPLEVFYCGICSLPPEYCEYGPVYDQCLPWIMANCPDLINEEKVTKMMGDVELDENEDVKKKKKRGGGTGPKKKAAVQEMKIIISRVQRQKKKFVTVVNGLDTVPDLKIKDATKIFGKKFASGSAVSETATGGKEIVIQGDVIFELPQLLVSQFQIPGTAIYTQDDVGGGLRPYM